MSTAVAVHVSCEEESVVLEAGGRGSEAPLLLLPLEISTRGRGGVLLLPVHCCERPASARHTLY